MSLARHFFREFRPLFRMLEEPLGRSPAFIGSTHRPFLEDPFFRDPFQSALRPAVDVVEEGNNYVVEAELPGVKKEDVHVRVGDGGRSVTIEGRVVDRRGSGVNQPLPEAQPSGAEEIQAPSQAGEGPRASAVTSASEPNQLSTERSFVGTSSFTRTVWLPRRVDSANVSAKLNDGILTLTIPKAEDPGSVEVTVQ
ncbi:HSP20-like chaperone [Cytidiella melzeri]|nr:HSP20-like chaperone [Cytidiella melzeri]